MDEDPARGVRREEGLLARARRRAGARRAGLRDGLAPATPVRRWRAALLRMGRLPGVARPCIATPLPPVRRAPRRCSSTPGPTPSARPEMLVQFAQMASAFVTSPLRGRTTPVGAAVDRRGASKGTPLVKETHALLAGGSRRATSSATSRVATCSPRRVDVVVTDGFTGNVALKTLEGALHASWAFSALSLARVDPRTRRRATSSCCSLGSSDAGYVDPEETGRSDAARARGRLHHQPRLVSSARPS